MNIIRALKDPEYGVSLSKVAVNAKMSFQRTMLVMFTLAIVFGSLIFSHSGVAHAERFAVYVDGMYWGDIEADYIGGWLWIHRWYGPPWMGGPLITGDDSGDLSDEVLTDSDMLIASFPSHAIEGLNQDHSTHAILTQAFGDEARVIEQGEVSPNRAEYQLVVILPSGTLSTILDDEQISAQELLDLNPLGVSIMKRGENN